MNLSESTVLKFEESLALRGRSRGTVAKYGSIIRDFTGYAQGRRAADPATSLARWIGEGRATHSAATVRLRLAAGRAFLDYLGVDRGPLADYKAPPLPEAEPHPLPHGIDDVRRMLTAAPTPALRRVIALGGLAGCRISESTSLERRHIVLRSGKRHLAIRGKGGRLRYVPISAELDAELATAPESGRMAALSDAGARHGITRVARAAGVRGHDGGEVSSHDLRATFASEVYARTGDLLLVSRLLGHANLNTTKVYLRRDTAKAEQAVEF